MADTISDPREMDSLLGCVATTTWKNVRKTVFFRQSLANACAICNFKIAFTRCDFLTLMYIYDQPQLFRTDYTNFIGLGKRSGTL